MTPRRQYDSESSRRNIPIEPFYMYFAPKNAAHLHARPVSQPGLPCPPWPQSRLNGPRPFIPLKTWRHRKLGYLEYCGETSRQSISITRGCRIPFQLHLIIPIQSSTSLWVWNIWTKHTGRALLAAQCHCKPLWICTPLPSSSASSSEIAPLRPESRLPQAC